jgi:hypothetical protein
MDCILVGYAQLLQCVGRIQEIPCRQKTVQAYQYQKDQPVVSIVV